MTKLFDSKPFIIAEVGSNWTSFEHAKDSISMAKQCGADAVKFQAFTAGDLYGYSRWLCGVPGMGGEMGYVVTRGNERPSDEVLRSVFSPDTIACEAFLISKADGFSEIDLDWLPKLKEKSDACGIEFMVTAFSPELVAAVDPYVSVHKVASSDLSYPQLLEAVAKTGKPIILSTGASSRGDIGLALNALGGAKDRTVLMYCASAYPSRRHNLYLMRELREEFGRPVGLSDHSTDVIYAPLSAHREFGAVAIEKHFTAFPELDTPDRPHSLTSDEFKIMVDYIRGNRDGGINPTSEERDMFLRHNRRLVATKDIPVGEMLQFGVNYGAYRSLENDSHGMSPFFWNHERGPEGKRAAKVIQRGKGVGPGDFS